MRLNWSQRQNELGLGVGTDRMQSMQIIRASLPSFRSHWAVIGDTFNVHFFSNETESANSVFCQITPVGLAAQSVCRDCGRKN